MEKVFPTLDAAYEAMKAADQLGIKFSLRTRIEILKPAGKDFSNFPEVRNKCYIVTIPEVGEPNEG